MKKIVSDLENISYWLKPNISSKNPATADCQKSGHNCS